jgi:fumarate reductase subunit C
MSYLQFLVVLQPTVVCCILYNIMLVQKVCCIGLHGGHLLAGFVDHILNAVQISCTHEMPHGHKF